MNRTQIFPTILIILDLASAIQYGLDGNVRKTLYWIAAAAITATVTY